MLDESLLLFGCGATLLTLAVFLRLLRFIRTTEAEHKATCQALWKRCAANGDIYLDTYKGWYLEREETFVTPKDAEEWNFKDPQTGKN